MTPADVTTQLGRLQATAIRVRTADVAQLEEAADRMDWAIAEIQRLQRIVNGFDSIAELACIGCGAEDDGAYSFAEDHPVSVDVGPFCSQCFEGIKELVIRWHDQGCAGAEG